MSDTVKPEPTVTPTSVPIETPTPAETVPAKPAETAASKPGESKTAPAETVKSKHVFIPIADFEKRAALRKLRKLPTRTFWGGAMLPSNSSLSQWIPTAYDQGSCGSCTSQCFAGAYQTLAAIKAGSTANVFMPSRLFFYYQERLIEGTVSTDSGGDVIDGEGYVQQNGICDESLWPYDITQFATAPTAACYAAAPSHKISSYATIQIDANLLQNIKAAIVNNTPVLIAIAVYSSFEASTNGVIPMPDTSMEQLLGGHEVLIYAFDDSTSQFSFLNSWATTWGVNGSGQLPYKYVSDPSLGQEFTIVTL